MEKIGYIYRITSPSGKSYIGQTTRFKERMDRHSLTNSKTKLSNSIKKYGWEAHRVDILWQGECTGEQLNTLEINFIELYGTFHNGLNLTEGGEGVKGLRHSEETKAKMSAANKGKKLPPRSEETKAKISAAGRGRAQSQEARDRRSAALKGRIFSEEHKTKIRQAREGQPGRSQSEETKAKIRTTLKNRVFSEEHRAKISAAKKGKVRGPLPEEVIAKRTATRKLRKEGKFLNKS